MTRVGELSRFPLAGCTFLQQQLQLTTLESQRSSFRFVLFELNKNNHAWIQHIQNQEQFLVLRLYPNDDIVLSENGGCAPGDANIRQLHE